MNLNKLFLLTVSCVQLILRSRILWQGPYYSLQYCIPLHNELVFRLFFSFRSKVNAEIKVGRRRIQIRASFHHEICLFSRFRALVVANVCRKKPTGIFLRSAQRYLTRCYLTALEAGGRERLTSWCLRTLQLIMFTLLGLAARSPSESHDEEELLRRSL